MTFKDLCTRLDGLPSLPRRIAVHPKTYQVLVAHSDMRFDPNTSHSAVGGLMGSLWGVDIITSQSVPEGQVLIWNADSPSFAPTVPMTPSVLPKPPPSPFDHVHRIKKVGPDQWEARDYNGQLLMELTEQGARDLSEQTGVRLND